MANIEIILEELNDSYSNLEIIGKGAYGHVYSGVR